MFNEFREKRFAPPPLLKRMVLAGLYGRKSGRGFYDYTEGRQESHADEPDLRVRRRRIAGIRQKIARFRVYPRKVSVLGTL
jgi:3-hydroxyacyl-CoA dehydrogenase